MAKGNNQDSVVSDEENERIAELIRYSENLGCYFEKNSLDYDTINFLAVGKVIACLNQYRGRNGADIRTMLRTAVYRGFIDVHRRRSREVSLDEVDSDGRKKFDFDEESRLDQRRDSYQRDFLLENVIREAMSKLPQRHRTILELRFYQGMTYSEIARLLGRKQSTIGTNIYYGIKNLKRILAGKIDFRS
ncbi:RNA polymerase sigma factor [Candidatus Pacearchaeota archaeon]|nr:RNA polymerase sigma factor [Candidatus Pacearchaeota archaeon]